MVSNDNILERVLAAIKATLTSLRYLGGFGEVESREDLVVNQSPGIQPIKNSAAGKQKTKTKTANQQQSRDFRLKSLLPLHFDPHETTTQKNKIKTCFREENLRRSASIPP